MLTARSPTQAEDTDDVIGVEETTTTSDTSPVVSLPDSQQSKLTISGTCHNRVSREPCNFMYKLDLSLYTHTVISVWCIILC